ncbi:type VI secretion system Vgr family protein [Litoribrevibacter albus]|uniref:Type IV secretion protein Rhs n=1 Tax=Litoribrevibacter albus TaxID=1473156 RepID=A0AA37S9Q5_9GAMM|nr:type VI secretion system tip protein VgrG [Litoribrevibacter albus]GLQ31860.1 type IV secretion protein Rhs [Litoribrevibacter albus]
MQKATQDANSIKIATPLGKDTLHLTRFDANEGISQAFRFEALMYTNGVEIDPKALIGQSVTVSLLMNKDGKVVDRFFNGIVSELKSLGQRAPNEADGALYKDYSATIVPTSWLMNHRVNCRIFQNLSVKDIAKKLFDEHGVKFSSKLKKTYPTYEYCVQYQESDWAFISRLLEQEGIFYFFEHEQNKHTLVMADDASVYEPCEEAKVKHATGSLAESHVHQWSSGLNITPGKYSQKGYDHEKPQNLPQGSRADGSLIPNQANYEVFEYEAESKFNERTQNIANVRLESLQKDIHTRIASSNCRSFTAGKTFEFSDHEDKGEIGQGYVITKLSMSASVLSQTGSSQSSEQTIINHFNCVPKNVIYRPAIKTPKPIIHGVQTAVVTGESGDEIHIDKYGRVKVQFHWDREGKKDSKSSCWIRVSQTWAGKRWGAFFFPRVGQEVLVEFLNGDPDQPIIIGAVYNADLMPPYDLPANKTQSGIKTRSTKTGSDTNFNELCFEDDKGNELIMLHAEKDHHLKVKNDQVDWIGNDRKTTIDSNETVTIAKDRNTKIDGGDTLKIAKKLTIEAGQEISLKTGGASITMKSDGTITIKGNKVTVEGATTNVKGSQVVIKGGTVAIN